MDAPEDAELLRLYAAEKSEAAFAELVRRHVNFVYGGALRRLGGDTHLAEDVTQRVFTVVAHDASALSRHPVLAGWLFTTTRYTAAQLVRGERRRRAREQEAGAMNEIHSGSTRPDWEPFRPELDAAMDGLGDRDREAVLLRFFQGNSFAEIGARLRLTENAARMRVERALEKMQAVLARRGVTSTAAALGVALAGQAGIAAPSGLATTVTTGALASTAIGAGVMAAFFGIMSTAKIVVGAVGVCACLATGIALFEAKSLRETRSELAAAAHEREGLEAKLRETESRLAVQSRRVTAAEEDIDKLLKVLKAAQASAPAKAAPPPDASAPVTRDLVDARFKRAQELARSGQGDEALQEFLWCFDEGMVRVSSYSGVRLSFLLGEIARLGETNPAALIALRERRDAAEQQLLASKNDYDAGTAFAAINRALKEEARTLQLFDQLPPDDPRRRNFGAPLIDLLVSAQRYRDAVRLTGYNGMNAIFEMGKNSSEKSPSEQKAQRDYMVRATSRNIEILAGANDLPHAKSLVDRLLAYDSSDGAKMELQQHLARAGHAELLASPP